MTEISQIQTHLYPDGAIEFITDVAGAVKKYVIDYGDSKDEKFVLPASETNARFYSEHRYEQSGRYQVSVFAYDEYNRIAARKRLSIVAA